jgi:hypothetical protein
MHGVAYAAAPVDGEPLDQIIALASTGELLQRTR